MAGEADRSTRGVRAALAAITLVAGAVHLALAATLELAPDEAYYWTWSTDLAWSFPDHPPLAAALIRLGTVAAGNGPVGVRWPFVLCGTMLIPIAFALGRSVGSRPRAALLGAALVALSPLGSAAALLATPDTPLALGWALGLLGLARAASTSRGWGAWAAVAVGTALAMGSKHSGVLLPILAGAWLFSSGGAAWRRRPHAYLALAAGILVVSPAWWADLGGGGAAAFQIGHGLWSPDLGPGERVVNLLGWTAGQVGLLGPLVAVGVVAFLAGAGGRDAPIRLLRTAAALPWLLFGAAALLATPEANWPAPAHLPAIVGAVAAAEGAAARGAAWGSRRWVVAAVAVQVAIAAALHLHVAAPFLPPGGKGGTFAGPTDPAARLHGWAATRAALERQGEPVMAGDYGVAAELRYLGFGGTLATPSDDGSVPAGDFWWVGPVAGPSLPGRRSAGAPAGCVVRTIDAAGVDPGLRRPAAPVRVAPIRCGGR
jgi:4-amino-4-deoxy-L-arabinose transferase-like glycosyltransferase